MAAGLALAGCAQRSAVVEIEPGIFALASHAASPATAARIGVEQARAHCTAIGHGFEPLRTEPGGATYRIAFRCPRPMPAWSEGAVAVGAAPPGPGDPAAAPVVILPPVPAAWGEPAGLGPPPAPPPGAIAPAEATGGGADGFRATPGLL